MQTTGTAGGYDYIRIELDRSNVDGRSFQASTDKMLYFQGLAGFYRGYCKLPNFRTSLENTGQTGFFGFMRDSSQTVVKYRHPIFCMLRVTADSHKKDIKKRVFPPKIMQPFRILFGTEGLQILRLICYDKRDSEKGR